MSNSLQPHGLQHTRLLCPLLSPWVCSNLCPLSQWCHPPISSSVAPFSSCPQFFPASGSFPMSRLFIASSQSIGVSALASVLPMNIQSWFPIRLTGLIPLQSKGLSRVFSNSTVQNLASILQCSVLFFMVQLSQPNMTTGKTTALTVWTSVGKVMSLFFKILSRFDMAILLSSKCLNRMQPLNRSDFQILKHSVWITASCHKAARVLENIANKKISIP